MRALGAGVVALAPFIQTLVINHPHHFPALIWPVASPPQPSNPQSLFPCSIPPHPPLSSAQIITSPLPRLHPPTSLSRLSTFDLSPPAESSHVHLRPTSTTAKLTFVSSKSGIPVLARNKQPLITTRLFSLFCGLDSVFQQPGSGERSHGSRSKTARKPAAANSGFPAVESSAAQPPSPVHGRLVRCPVHTSTSSAHTRCLPHLPRARPSPLSVRISYTRPPPDRSSPKTADTWARQQATTPGLQVDEIVAESSVPSHHQSCV